MMKKTLAWLATLLLLIQATVPTSLTFAQGGEENEYSRPLIMTLNVTSGNVVTLYPSNQEEFVIERGDNTTDTYTGQGGTLEHTYATDGLLQVTLSGDALPRLGAFNGWKSDKVQQCIFGSECTREAKAPQLVSIDQWGDFPLSKGDVYQSGSLDSAFAFSNNLVIKATDTPNLSTVGVMSYMFYGATNLTGNFSGRDTRTIKSMTAMFANTSGFNSDLRSREVSNVENMVKIFSGAVDFDQNLSSRCVTKISQEPALFSPGSALSASHKPVWGTCPTDNNEENEEENTENEEQPIYTLTIIPQNDHWMNEGCINDQGTIRDLTEEESEAMNWSGGIACVDENNLLKRDPNYFIYGVHMQRTSADGITGYLVLTFDNGVYYSTGQKETTISQLRNLPLKGNGTMDWHFVMDNNGTTYNRTGYIVDESNTIISAVITGSITPVQIIKPKLPEITYTGVVNGQTLMMNASGIVEFDLQTSFIPGVSGTGACVGRSYYTSLKGEYDDLYGEGGDYNLTFLSGQAYSWVSKQTFRIDDVWTNVESYPLGRWTYENICFIDGPDRQNHFVAQTGIISFTILPRDGTEQLIGEVEGDTVIVSGDHLPDIIADHNDSTDTDTLVELTGMNNTPLVEVDFSGVNEITTKSGWDLIFQNPVILPNIGFTMMTGVTTLALLSIGATETGISLNLDTPALITFYNLSGHQAARRLPHQSRNLITDQCFLDGNDTLTFSGNAKECRYYTGNNLQILTQHFSEYAVIDEAPQCGSANGSSVTTAPTTNLCAIGQASTVQGNGPRTWTCGGEKGGITVSCQASKSANGGNSSGISGGGGGGGSSLSKDSCPMGDNSGSYYDDVCGDTAQIKTPEATTTKEPISTTITSTTATNKSELELAYDYAFANGITTMDTLEKARTNDPITRAELAKMISQYAIKVLEKTPDTQKHCGGWFGDIAAYYGSDLYENMILSCQLNLMGIQSDGMPLSKFRPDDKVSRAEFGTVLSRLLRGSTYEATPEDLFNNPNEVLKFDNKGNIIYDGKGNYYEKHLQALKKADIITNDTPTLTEIRGFIFLMLMRSAK